MFLKSKGLSHRISLKSASMLFLILTALPIHAYSFDIAGIQLGDNYEKIKKMHGYKLSSFGNGDIENGFKIYSTGDSSEDYAYSYETRPDGMIYKMRYHQYFDIEFAEKVKLAVCKKYSIRDTECVWKNKIDIKEIGYKTFFSVTNREKDEVVSIRIRGNTEHGKDVNPPNLELLIFLMVEDVPKKIQQWLEDIKAKAKETRIENAKEKDLFLGF